MFDDAMAEFENASDSERPTRNEERMVKFASPVRGDAVISKSYVLPAEEKNATEMFHSEDEAHSNDSVTADQSVMYVALEFPHSLSDESKLPLRSGYSVLLTLNPSFMEWLLHNPPNSVGFIWPVFGMR